MEAGLKNIGLLGREVDAASNHNPEITPGHLLALSSQAERHRKIEFN